MYNLKDLINTIICGDCLELLKNIPVRRVLDISYITIMGFLVMILILMLGSMIGIIYIVNSRF